MNEEDERREKARLLALLESQHSFPGPYTFKVIYRNKDDMSEHIRARIKEATGIKITDGQVAVRSSSAANFLSMTLDMDIQTAQEVLDVYDVLSTVEDIVSWF